jgi:hypothetical protein
VREQILSLLSLINIYPHVIQFLEAMMVLIYMSGTTEFIEENILVIPFFHKNCNEDI